MDRSSGNSTAIPSPDNADLWSAVTSRLACSPCIWGVDPDPPLSSPSPENPSKPGHQREFAPSALIPPPLVAQLLDPRAVQRRVLACVSEGSTALPTLETGPGWAEEEVALCRGLVVAEEVLGAACDRVVELTVEMAEIVAFLVLLPTVCQLPRALPHPVQSALRQCVLRHPKPLVLRCLAPALRHTSSQDATLLLTEILRDLGQHLLPHLHHLLSALEQRSQVGEEHLPVLEAACGALASLHTHDVSQPAHFVSVAVSCYMSALQHVCAAIPAHSPSVGRTLLATVHKLSVHLQENADLRRDFELLLDGHTSPLRRPITAQLSKGTRNT